MRTVFFLIISFYCFSASADSSDPLSADNPSSFRHYLKEGNNSEPAQKIDPASVGEISNNSKSNLSIQKYYKCLQEEAVKYSKVNEPAETIADTAIAACEGELINSLEKYAFWQDLPESSRQSFINQTERNSRKIALKSVMDARLN